MSTSTGRQKVFTRDLSACGAFFLTQRPLTVGTAIKVKLLLQPRLSKQTKKRKSAQINVRGVVVRTDADGMGVQFDRSYKIASVGEGGMLPENSAH